MINLRIKLNQNLSPKDLRVVWLSVEKSLWIVLPQNISSASAIFWAQFHVNRMKLPETKFWNKPVIRMLTKLPEASSVEGVTWRRQMTA